MKQILPWLILPYLTLSHADSTDSASLTNMLNQVSEEAAQTTLENVQVKPSPTAIKSEPSAVQSEEVDVDQLTQSIAGRLSEILEVKKSPEQLSMSLESIVNSALHDGKQMDEIRVAVEQAMKEVTGQPLQLSPDVLKIEQEMVTHSKQELTPAPSAVVKTPKVTPVSEPAPKTAAKPQSEENQPATSLATESTTTVLPGESLYRVAQRIYGKENGRRFLDIYEANKDVIEDINVVVEGQVLKLP